MRKQLHRWILALVISCIGHGALAQSEDGKESEVTTGSGGYGGGEAGGYGGGSYGSGGYGGGYGGEGYDGVYAQPSLSYAVVKWENGKRELTPYKATRVKGFVYSLGSLKPEEIQLNDYSGGYMGGYGGMSGDGGAGGYGGEMMGGYGGGPRSRSRRASKQAPEIVVYAYIFDDNRDAGAARIDLVTYLDGNSQGYMGFGDEGLGASSGGGYGPGGEGEGYGPGGGSGYGTEGGYGGAGAGMGESQAYLPKYVDLKTLSEEKTGRRTLNTQRLQSEEYSIIAATMRQLVWKADVIQAIHRDMAKPDQLVKLEKKLRQLLSDQYETQLERQALEVQRIERKVNQLKEEMARRRNAKARVVDVQLGRIVLEAQGLLEK